MKTLLTIICSLIVLSCYSQSDTSYLHDQKKWRYHTHKDTFIEINPHRWYNYATGEVRDSVKFYEVIDVLKSVYSEYEKECRQDSIITSFDYSTDKGVEYLKPNYRHFKRPTADGFMNWLKNRYK
jgi:hypothetical protein